NRGETLILHQLRLSARFFRLGYASLISQRRASTQMDALRGSVLPTFDKSRPLVEWLLGCQSARRAAAKFPKNQERHGSFPHSPGIVFHTRLRMGECLSAEKNPAKSSLAAVLP